MFQVQETFETVWLKSETLSDTSSECRIEIVFLFWMCLCSVSWEACGRRAQRFFPSYFLEALAGDWQLTSGERKPPTKALASIRLPVTAWKWLNVLRRQAGGGAACVCASNCGKTIMGKQRASLPLSTLRCTSHLPLNHHEKMAWTPSLRRFGSGLALTFHFTLN